MRAVDLFAGCGAMSLGLQEAARRAGRRFQVRLAVDIDKAATETYSNNLPVQDVRAADVATLFDGELGATVTRAERKVRKAVGRVDVLLGGPPCQGHSDLNNHTRRRDPKNALYLRMARAAEVLKPAVVVVENVASVQLDEAEVVKAASRALVRAGYQVAGRVVDLRRVGVPQRRRRFLLLASKLPGINPTAVLERLAGGMPDHPDRTVGWAIRDLLGAAGGAYDSSGRASKRNARRIARLFDERRYTLPNRHRPKCHRGGGHSYVSMYGRLRWDRPAQTITTGFGSMGQGRYVHPARHRTITPHEAARLQTFPDSFDFGDRTSRKTLARMIGNAVPPLLMVALGAEILGGVGEVPSASSAEVLRRMRATRRRDTPGELAVRRLLHARGLRFQVDRQVLPGTRRRADLAFPSARVAAFVDGCFWHSCPRHGTQPKTNAAWWAAKLARNRRRDAETNRQLGRAGWAVVRVWEHEAPAAAAARIASSVLARLRRGASERAG